MSYVVYDWAGNLMFDGRQFEDFEDAEEFLNTILADNYVTDRQEYYISEVDESN